MTARAAIFVLGLAACGDDPGATRDAGAAGDAGPTFCTDVPLPSPLACNGAAALCDRRFDEVAYATTHNAMASEEDRFAPPNQRSGITRQLDDGIRALMLDTHDFAGEPHLCHGSCWLGRTPLAAGLRRIAAWLSCHPAEVVTIIFEAYVSAAVTRAAFDDAGLTPFVHEQARGAPWPTLGELVASGRRLVILTDDDDDGGWAGYHHVWDHAFETHYHYESVDALSCDDNRGEPGAPLFILNHFLTAPTALPELAEMINHEPLLGDRVRTCEARYARIASFVTVDFYEIGDVLAVVGARNAAP